MMMSQTQTLCLSSCIEKYKSPSVHDKERIEGMRALTREGVIVTGT
jgi:hypothetical protein